jgi:hypothetical protein
VLALWREHDSRDSAAFGWHDYAWDAAHTGPDVERTRCCSIGTITPRLSSRPPLALNAPGGLTRQGAPKARGQATTAFVPWR